MTASQDRIAEPSRLFNSQAAKKPPVKYKLPRQERNRRRQVYSAYYDEKIDQIREYFQLKGFETADAFLDVLLECKTGEWRKDGYTPDFGHEIDLLLSRISAIENGTIDVPAAEAKYSPIESFLISPIVHDLGEDYGLMPSDLSAKVHKKLNKKIGDGISQNHFRIIHRGVQSMERLTHDRHYSPEELKDKFGKEFKEIYGTELQIPSPKKRQILELDDDVKAFLWDKMDVIPEHTNDNFQAFILIDRKGKQRISVTQYGKFDDIGADWNAYSNAFMADAYDAGIKFSDSANGMSSRLSIESFTADGGNRYLRKRAQLFDLNGAAARNIRAYDSLKKDFRSVGSLMAVCYVFGRILLNHDPMMNDPGESGFSARSLAKGKDGLIHVDLKKYPEFAFDSYALTPGLSHPIARFMQQYRDVVGFYEAEGHPWAKDVRFLYEQTRGVLIRDCAEPCRKNGLNIVDLIDNPEKIDLMPGILQKAHNDNFNANSAYDQMPPEPGA